MAPHFRVLLIEGPGEKLRDVLTQDRLVIQGHSRRRDDAPFIPCHAAFPCPADERRDVGLAEPFAPTFVPEKVNEFV